MNKSEFMESLKRNLSGIPAGDREEILYDYEEHFRNGLADGKSEEEIAESLGDPAAIAGLFTGDHDQKGGSTTFGSKVIEDVDIKRTVDLAGITKICVRTVGIPINLVPGEENIASLRLHGRVLTSTKMDLEVDQKGNQLTISVERNFPDKFVTYSRLQLDICLPPCYSGELVIKTVSGNTRVDKLNPGEFSFKSVSGDLLFEPANKGSTVYQYMLNTVSGKIRVKLPSCSEFHLNAKTVSGKIESNVPIQKAGWNHFEGNTGSTENNIDVKTVSGDIQIYRKE